VGFDYHEASIDVARKQAAEAGLADRVRFEVASATDFPGTGYELVCIFDALHDMGDPVAAAAGGFTRFRRAAETSFNAVLEVRP
jgi:cyclopropane fatty-acyl-phospholipid synthase-like methyltransferase